MDVPGNVRTEPVGSVKAELAPDESSNRRVTSPYLDWNDALVRHFFKPDVAGEPVWLVVTDELISELGTQIGGRTRDDFVEAVKDGPPWVSARGLCQRALQSLARWRQRGLEHPPYVGYLALFVIAAGLEGDFARHAYYPRLRELLGEPGEGHLPSFERMVELWDDLELWSTRDRNGELGLFEARIVGGHFHIGLPIAQAILSEAERRALPRIFATAGLDPSSPPPEDELARLLRTRAGADLRPRTRELLRTHADSEAYEVLLDAVLDELVRWDGSFLDSTLPGAERQRFSSIRLCARFDRVSGRLVTYLRCRIGRNFPDEGVTLSGAISSLECVESGIPEWSSALTREGGGDLFEADVVDWATGISLIGNDRSRYSIPERQVRILQGGEDEGLPDLVEVRHIPRGRRLYFLFQTVDWPRLRPWAETECQEFRQERVSQGLRPGWQLASCAEVMGDSKVRLVFPELALPQNVRILLVGGIKHTGQSYFHFAVPSVKLEGNTDGDTLRCGGHLLIPDGTTKLYLLPADLPVDARVTLEVVREGLVIRRKSLYVTGEVAWLLHEPQCLADKWGEPSEDAMAGNSGALLIGGPSSDAGCAAPIMLTPGLRDTRAPTIVFLGRVPGQVYTWPAEAVRANWSPTWGIPMGRNGHAVYCGSDVEADSPEDKQVNVDRRLVRAWKEVLWYRRKRISPPDDDLVQELWQKYVQSARNV